MSIGVNTNIGSIIARNAVGATQTSMNTSIQRLSTGLRINSAQDDPAGLAIAARMTSQINGLNQAALNANFGISLGQTAGGALSQATSALATVRQLAVESANASNTSVDRVALDTEAQQLIQQVQTIATQTQFNGQNILDGSFGTAQFQVGANANQTISCTTGNIQTSALGGYTVVGTSTTAALNTGDLILNNIYVGATTDGQASTMVAAINAVSGQSNITATGANSVTGASAAASQATVGTDITVNGTNIGAVAAGGSASVEATEVANAINAVTATTGVTATVGTGGSANKIILSNNTGADITVVTTANGATASGFTAGTTTAHGTITLNSSAAMTIAGTTPAKAGLTAGTSSGTLTALNTINLQSVANANTAISAVDGALAQINSLQASIGAVETRFQAVVNNLQTASQNLTSARSGVQDADFAAESANLSKQQILEQAGIAMVAQANSLPSQVLTLLQQQTSG